MSPLRLPDWQEQAECRDTDIPDAFHSSRDTPRSAVRAAVAMCRRCPVAAECLETALSEGLTTGLWGGVSEERRRRMHLRRSV